MIARAAAEITVVIPSHERPWRLGRLLDALAAQTLDSVRFEVIVVHDSAGTRTATLLDEHSLAREGQLRTLRLAPGTGLPARQRNVGWRAAQSPLIAFTDDDCRPDRDWLARALEAIACHPGSFVQGATRPEPGELCLLRRPLARTLTVDPPTVHAQTCNMVYPRDLLERLGGFDERMPAPAGEDTELALRATEAGARQVGAPAAIVYHAVTVPSLAHALRDLGRWQHLAYVVKRHPRLRAELYGRVFWKPAHAWLLMALLATGLSLGSPRKSRQPALLALVVPWAWTTMPSYGPSVRGRLRAVTELPLRALIDTGELLVALRGSLRYRTLFL